MNRLITDNPQNNTENLLNLIFVKDKEVWVRYGSEAGEDCTLVEFCRRLCAACGTCSYEEVPYQTGDDLDDIGDILMDCSCDGCPVGTTYFAMIQAAELRERLRMYEDRGVMPDELERLLLCRHNCKIDCLLKQHDGLKALVRARIDRMLSVLPAADPHEIEFMLEGLKAEMEAGE